jgi:hypothetical protein
MMRERANSYGLVVEPSPEGQTAAPWPVRRATRMSKCRSMRATDGLAPAGRAVGSDAQNERDTGGTRDPGGRAIFPTSVHRGEGEKNGQFSRKTMARRYHVQVRATSCHRVVRLTPCGVVASAVVSNRNQASRQFRRGGFVAARRRRPLRARRMARRRMGRAEDRAHRSAHRQAGEDGEQQQAHRPLCPTHASSIPIFRRFQLGACSCFPDTLLERDSSKP